MSRLTYIYFYLIAIFSKISYDTLRDEEMWTGYN